MPVAERLSTLRQVLSSPRAFFRGRSPDLGDVLWVLAAVVVVKVVAVVSVEWLLGAVDASSGSLGARLAGLAVVLTLLMGALFLVGWVLVSAVLHLWAMSFDGTGSFRETLYVVGWSTPAALVVPLVLTLGVALLVLGGGVGGESAALSGAHPDAISLVGTVGSLLAIAWQGYVWRGGLRLVHGLSRDRATRAAALTGFMAALPVLAVA